MDQDAYRDTYRQVNERQCVFEKGVLTNQCHCSQVEKLCIAEREAAHCLNDAAQANCIHFLQALKTHARFALKLHDEQGVLPHAKAIKLQIGGLRGLHHVVYDSEGRVPVLSDVAGLIAKALETYPDLDGLPYSRIMQQVAAYEGRKRLRPV